MPGRLITESMVLRFPRGEEEAADLVETACRRSLSVLEETWPLHPPKRFGVHVMTSWIRFLLAGSPWLLRPLVLVALPMLIPRYRRFWPFVGGVTLLSRWWRPAVGVKPPRLLAEADTRVGEMVFFKEPDLVRKMEHIVCHEMTHAYAASLRLPPWLNEGIAMISVDRYFGTQTVRPETIRFMPSHWRRTVRIGYRKVPRLDIESLAGLYASGYWVTRYLHETRGDLLLEILRKKRSHRSIRRMLARSHDVQPSLIWKELERVVTVRSW